METTRELNGLTFLSEQELLSIQGGDSWFYNAGVKAGAILARTRNFFQEIIHSPVSPTPDGYWSSRSLRSYGF